MVGRSRHWAGTDKFAITVCDDHYELVPVALPGQGSEQVNGNILEVAGLVGGKRFVA